MRIFLKTGFLCAILTVLELALYTRLTSNSQRYPCFYHYAAIMRNFYEHILFILEKYLSDKYSNTETTLVQRHILRFLASENHVTSCYIMLHHGNDILLVT